MIQSKTDFLTANEVAKELNCSTRTVNRLIANKSLPATNLGVRLTRVIRKDLEEYIKNQEKEKEKEKEQETEKVYSIEDCYTISEVQEKYNISNGALYNLIKREQIPKTQKGKFVYVPKNRIDKIFT